MMSVKYIANLHTLCNSFKIPISSWIETWNWCEKLPFLNMVDLGSQNDEFQTEVEVRCYYMQNILEQISVIVIWFVPAFIKFFVDVDEFELNVC